jgi:carbamoyl-phosphate synthase large subunit
MEPLTLLITGAGGVASAGLAEHLRSKGCRVLMADIDPYAPGLLFGNKGFVIPKATSPQFVEIIRNICVKEGVNVLIPLVDEELLPAQLLESDSLHVVTPRREFIEACLDKFELMQRLRQAGVQTPETWLLAPKPTPLTQETVIKPRTGRGSRGVVRVATDAQLEEALRTSSYLAEDLLAQEYVAGPEYTVSVVVWRDGVVQAVVPKEVIVKRGVTRIAITRRNQRIEQLCRRIQSALRADGPFNVQLRLHPSTGEPLPFEINPRYSTTASLTLAAGIDEVYGLAMQAVGGRKAFQFGEWKDGLVLRRRSVDEFLPEAEFLCDQRTDLCWAQ